MIKNQKLNDTIMKTIQRIDMSCRPCD